MSSHITTPTQPSHGTTSTSTTMFSRRALGGLGAIAALAAIAACGETKPTPASGNSSSGSAASGSGSAPAASATSGSSATAVAADAKGPIVVATTNVYASIARLVAGDDAQVSSILQDKSADPHEFEVTPADKLQISKSNIFVVNGGGYDEWAHMVMDSLTTKPVMIDAFELSPYAADMQEEHQEEPSGGGHDHVHDHGNVNEHVFYDFGTMKHVADALATQLGKLDTANSETFIANAKSFKDKLTALTPRAANPKTLKYLATEPVADYLAGMVATDETPKTFKDAIADSNDPSVADIKAVSDVLDSKTIAFVLYNAQTSDKVVDQVRDLATKNSIPVIPVTELLPPGTTSYLDWVGATVAKINQATSK